MGDKVIGPSTYVVNFKDITTGKIFGGLDMPIDHLYVKDDTVWVAIRPVPPYIFYSTATMDQRFAYICKNQTVYDCFVNYGTPVNPSDVTTYEYLESTALYNIADNSFYKSISNGLYACDDLEIVITQRGTCATPFDYLPVTEIDEPAKFVNMGYLIGCGNPTIGYHTLTCDPVTTTTVTTTQTTTTTSKSTTVTTTSVVPTTSTRTTFTSTFTTTMNVSNTTSSGIASAIPIMKYMAQKICTQKAIYKPLGCITDCDVVGLIICTIVPALIGLAVV